MSLSSYAALDWKIRNCVFCPLHKTRINAVPGTGSILPPPQILFVGEAPGKDEDEQGAPFVGRSGQLLDKALDQAQLPRKEVFITNIVKCRPPNNRDPSPEETSACRPYLEKQIELLHPQLIVAIGRVAAAQLLGREVKITKERGKIDFLPTNPNIAVLTVYHPSYVLRNRHTQVEKDFFQDILYAKEIAYGAVPAAGILERSSG